MSLCEAAGLPGSFYLTHDDLIFDRWSAARHRFDAFGSRATGRNT
ncbi:MAG: hypothetical protein AAF678_08365 [Pseudomonadota bacterium]